MLESGYPNPHGPAASGHTTQKFSGGSLREYATSQAAMRKDATHGLNVPIPTRPRVTISWLTSILAAMLIVVLVVIPVAAAANVQVLWSNESSLMGFRFGDFDGDGRTDVFRISGSQWQFSSGGTGAWQDLYIDPSSTAIDDLRFGDFNGDGRTDIFSVLGTQWRYSSAGVSNWIPLASDSTSLADLRFGDFNGDGRTDVFGVSGSQWRYSAGGASNWINLASDPTPIQDLRFGDFNGDGRTDVFSSLGGQWRYSASATSNWILLAFDPTPLQELRFGDFDRDGSSDVFSISGTQWRYSSGGVSGWVPLATDSTPLGQLRFGDFDGDQRTDVFSINGSQWRYSSGGASNWIDLNQSGPTATPTSTPGQSGAIGQLRFGDFDADGRTDVFRSQSGQWQFSSAGTGAWQNLAWDSLPLVQLRFGNATWDYRIDFNGDDRTDVFSVSGSQWRYSDGGASSWINLASDPTSLEDLRFGDFDGNGRTDVFSTSGGQWRYSADGTANWTALATDSRTINELRFGDFNGDGRTDVFSISGTQWQYSSAGLSNWVSLATDSTPLQDLRFGDFNGDGRTDVFSVSGSQWRYSSGGTSNWISLASDATPLSQLRFGDFNGDGRTDVFSIDSNGRWRYSASGTSNWILLGPPGDISTPTPTGWPTYWPTPTNWPTYWPTPTITATPVPPLPPNCINIAVNSDMEREGGWMFGDSPAPASYSGAQKHSGLRSIRMGVLPEMGGPNRASYSSVRQPITLPGNTITAQLRWWHLYGTEEAADPGPTNRSDRQEVILLTPHGQTLRILQRVRRNDGVWQEEAVDLTEFAGQTFYIYFNTFNDTNGSHTWMYLDDVTVDVCSPPPMQVAPNSVPVNEGNPYWQTQPYDGTQPNQQNQPYWNSQPYQEGQPYASNESYGSAPPAVDGQPYAAAEPYAGGEPYASAETYAPGQMLPTVQPPPQSQGLTGPQAAEATSTPSPTDTASPTPTSTPTNTPTPTPTGDREGAASPEGDDAQGQALSDNTGATPLPAIPTDVIRAEVLRVVDGETIEVVILGDMDPDAVDAPAAPELIPANSVTRMNIGQQLVSWRGQTMRTTYRVQSEPPGTTVVIRYADIETPDIITEDGEAAAAANRAMVEGQSVYLEIVDPAPESDGAVSAFVFLEDGEMVNAAMVRQGHAVISPSAQNSKYEARLIAAQTEAQETGSGMWAMLPEEANGSLAFAQESPTSEATVGSETPPTPSPAATAARSVSDACVELLMNGSFEEGDAYWNFVDGERPPQITDAVTFRESGSSLQLGIVDGENVASISAADQLVDLPTDAYSIVLSLRYYPISDSDPGPGDLQYVDVYNASTGQFAGRVFSGQRDDRTWLAANYDLSLFAGQPLRIVLAVNNDGVAGTTAVYVDDVSVLACNLPAAPGSGGESESEPDTDGEGAGAAATPTLQTALTTQDGETQLATGRPWLVKMFTGAVMFGILTIIGIAALVIMNSSSAASATGEDKSQDAKDGDTDETA